MEAEWAALAEGQGAPPSLHPGYIRSWAEGFTRPDRIRVGTVREDGRLTGAAAVVLGARGSASGPRESEQWGALGETPEAAVTAASVALSAARTSTTLRPVPGDDGTLQLVRLACREGGMRMIQRVVDVHPLIDITTDWDTYAAGITKLRRDVERRRRRLGEHGEVRVEVVTGGDRLEPAMEAALAVEASGWKGRSGTAIVQDAAGTRFYRGLARWAADRGFLRLNLLHVGDEVVAFAFELSAYDIRYRLKSGYREEYAKASPGKVLLAETVENAFADGIRQYDFSGTTRSHMTGWANSERQYLEVVVFARGPLGRAAELTERLRWRARPLAKRVRNRIRERRAGGAG